MAKISSYQCELSNYGLENKGKKDKKYRVQVQTIEEATCMDQIYGYHHSQILYMNWKLDKEHESTQNQDYLQKRGYNMLI